MKNARNRYEEILIVDDEQTIRLFLSLALKRLGYDKVKEAGSAEEGFETIRQTKPSLVMTDIHMPGESGLALLKKAKEFLPDVAVIIMTASDDLNDAIASLNQGADRYLMKPLNVDEVRHTVDSVLEKRRLVLENREYQRSLEEKVTQRTEELRRTLRELDHANQEIRVSYIETIYRLTVTAEYRDEETGSHIRRIGHYSRVLARESGLPPNKVEEIFLASPMHDMGKIGIPDSILRKPDSLTPEEVEIMKTHTTIGANILKGSSSEYLKVAERIALTHHEKWDGSGYPSGLKGEAIPIEGRIVSVADMYDALRSKRPYKPGLDHETACRIITGGDRKTSPEHFGPDMLVIFRKSAQELARLFAENQ